MEINMTFFNDIFWYIGLIIFIMGGSILSLAVILYLTKMITNIFSEQKLFIEFAQWRMNKKKQDEIKLRFPNIQREDDK